MRKPRFHTILFWLLIAVTFSPLVIAPGETGPWFLGMPRTLWMGILISFGLWILTLLAALNLIHEDERKKKKD